jgi:hypothetical protein
MTAQADDSVFYQGTHFSLAGINGSGLFDPADHGIKAESGCTACYRGYICGYEVAEGMLFLSNLSIGLEQKEGEGLPKILGKTPHQPTYSAKKWNPETRTLEEVTEPTWFVEVTDLHHPVPFNGGLLIGNDFVRSLYVHMGFHPAYTYRKVHELLFEDGRLVKEADRSLEMAEYRAAIESTAQEPADLEDQERLRQWIEQRFSRHYK